jgi:hypothetical protein
MIIILFESGLLIGMSAGRKGPPYGDDTGAPLFRGVIESEHDS